MKNYSCTIMAIATLAFGAAGQAEIVGTENDNTYISVGNSEVSSDEHTPGYAGIGVYTLDGSRQVDFQFLTTKPTYFRNDVYTILPDPGVTAEGHKSIGEYHFGQAGSPDAFYGEWSEDGDPHFTHHTVYYVGDDASTLMPLGGVVEYTIKGINRFTGNNDANGTYNADFDAGTISGYINNGVLGFGLSANVNGDTFAGSMYVFDHATSTMLAYGSAEGHFYGIDAAGVAGIATFTGSDSQYNVAFGGEY